MSKDNRENPEKGKLDNIDKTILSFLIKNARMPYLEIAREVGVSGAAIHQRIRKLEESGIIVGSRLIVKPRALGLELCAYVGIKITQANNYEPIISELRQMSEVVECHFVAGNLSLLLKIYCENKDHLMDVLINRISNINGISETLTFISLSQPIEREVYVKGL